ncbi:MAG: helicase-related protein [Clostridia bacterium]|nr:helicase-related protein [Clostridia bacterium]
MPIINFLLAQNGLLAEGDTPQIFNGGMDDIERAGVQKSFKNNEFSLLVATKAFGMGVNKPNIRYTFHYGIPSSIEALYQEAGRSGRDGKRADCYIILTKIREGFANVFGIENLNYQNINVWQDNAHQQNAGGDVGTQLFL